MTRASLVGKFLYSCFLTHACVKLISSFSRNCKRGDRFCSYNSNYDFLFFFFSLFSYILIVTKEEQKEIPAIYDGLIIYPQPDAALLPPVELRLLQHLVAHESDSRLLSSNDAYSLWVRKLPRSEKTAIFASCANM